MLRRLTATDSFDIVDIKLNIICYKHYKAIDHPLHSGPRVHASCLLCWEQGQPINQGAI